MQTQREFILLLLADYLEDLDKALRKECVSVREIEVLRRNFKLMRESLLAPKKIPASLLERIKLLAFPVIQESLLTPEMNGLFRFNSITDRNYLKNRSNIRAKLIMLKEDITELHRAIIKIIPRVQQEN